MRIALAPLAALLALAGCDRQGPAPQPGNVGDAVTVDVPLAIDAVEGVTPMAERVAVIGLLNKRNGISRELTMKPGQALRVGDVIVRLRACETTAPWEVQTLTGAFVQVDVRNPQDQFQRVFSGWLYKETPSLNVVEHPIYDVWPKSCAMTHPVGTESPPRSGSDASRRSRAPNSGGSAAPTPGPEPVAPPESPPPSAADNIIT